MKKKKESITLNNNMKQLAAGIVPTATMGVHQSKNMINSTATLAKQVRADFITLNYPLLSFLYQQFGWIQSIVEVPVNDAFRGGIHISAYENKVIVPEKKHKKGFWSFWNATEEKNNKGSNTVSAGQQFMEEQFKKREQWEKEQIAADEKMKKSEDSYFREEISREEIRRLEIYIRRSQIWEKIKQALIWNRLYGGSGIIVLDGKRPDKPLVLEDINEETELEFVIVDNWMLAGVKPAEMTTGNVKENKAIDWMSDTPFSVNGHPVHKSRVITFKGKEFPPLYRTIGRGWGMSILEPLVRTLNKSIKNENVIFELLDEAKMDVFKFYGFNDAMQDDQATQAITNRVGFAEQTKNYMNGILLDAEDEYAQKQIHFNGLSDLKVDARVDVAADARITMNKLYGTSPAGFNSGESDRETYADTVESEIRIPSEAAIIRMLEIIGRKVLGKTLDFDIEWASLIRTSAYEEEKRKTLQLANLNEANTWGRITNKEWQQAVNKYNLLGMDVTYKEKFVADPMAKQVFKPGFGG